MGKRAAGAAGAGAVEGGGSGRQGDLIPIGDEVGVDGAEAGGKVVTGGGVVVGRGAGASLSSVTPPTIAAPVPAEMQLTLDGEYSQGTELVPWVTSWKAAGY